MSDYQNVLVVIPSLDPDDKLLAVIRGVQEKGFTDILLVDDGSSEDKQHFFDEGAALGCHVLHHGVNKGKGRALKTAFEWFMENRKQSAGVVTIDGDNQHLPKDIAACVDVMFQQEKDSLILGVRDFNLPHVPPKSRFGNKLTSSVFRLFCGLKVSDTQTGLRAIPTEDIRTLITIYGDRFEYETNMLLAMKDYGIDFDEVKIRTVYIEENKSSHFHAIKDSWRIYKLILKHFFRYTISSIVSAVVDNGMFALLSGLLHGIFSGFPLTAVCTVSARVVSSLLNFFMNHRLVFQSRVSVSKAMLRYYMLAIPQMAAQVLLTQGVYALLNIPDSATGLRTLLYAVVMTVLYIASYVIQQRWVFAAKKSKK